MVFWRLASYFTDKSGSSAQETCHRTLVQKWLKMRASWKEHEANLFDKLMHVTLERHFSGVYHEVCVEGMQDVFEAHQGHFARSCQLLGT